MIAAISVLKRSLTARFLFVFALMSIIMSSLLFFMIVHGFTGQWKHNIRPHLTQYLNYIHDDIGDPPSIEQAQALSSKLPINIYIIGPDVNYSSTGLALDLNDVKFRKHTRKHRPRHLLSRPNAKLAIGDHQDRTVHRVTVGDFQVYYELAHTDKKGHRDRFIRNIILGILVVLLICFLIFRRMLRPVQDIKIGVHRMGQGELKHRVPIRSDNDLGILAGSINTMADDIEKMLDAKRQLLLGVSHELRSPLTRANVALKLMDETSYTKQIEAELHEMENLITEILETERINTRHAVINRTAIDVVAVARAVIDELGFDAVQVICASDKLAAELDEPRLKLLLRNLLSNAVKHSSEAHAPPQLSISRKDDFVVLDVTDFGSGISAEHLQHITEPFYRADPSRTRSTGGFGIGLYLCKLICEAHQGDLQVQSEVGKGTRMTARLHG